MNINIYYFGKIKKEPIIELVNHYKKLASKYFNPGLIELKDPGERKIELEDVSDLIGEFNVFLTESGRQFSSTSFSKYVEGKKLTISKINFFVGNAYGFSKKILEKSNLNLSLSGMTFPHELSLVLLLEQLFRAGSIAAGSKYHK